MKVSMAWKGLLTTIVTVSACTTIGCSSQPYPRAGNMVPQLARPSPAKMAEKTILVIGPTEGETGTNPLSTGPGYGQPTPSARITLTTFDEALQKTLRQSGLFKEVISSGQADYELSVPHFAQHMILFSMFPQWKFGAMVAAKYKFVDMTSGKKLWQGTVFSGCKNFVYETPANECAMRYNLSRLVSCLEETMSGTGALSKACAQVTRSACVSASRFNCVTTLSGF